MQQHLRIRLFNSLHAYNSKISRCFAETAASQSSKEIVGKEFELESNWEARFADINRIGLGNTSGYEWIALVQKKFVSTAKAR